MSSHRSRGALAVIATVLVFAFASAGCGRRGLPAEAVTDDVAATQALATTAATTVPAAATTVPPPSAAATAPPVASPAAASPPPLATPDLAAIDDLLAELDAALGADATADTDEGSTR